MKQPMPLSDDKRQKPSFTDEDLLKRWSAIRFRLKVGIWAKAASSLRLATSAACQTEGEVGEYSIVITNILGSEL